MLLKNEFYHMCNHLGIEDSELTLAEIIWSKAERAMQGKPVQEAKLLKNEVFTRNNDNLNALTQAELQSLTDGLALVLNHDKQKIAHLKKLIELLWLKSNPDNPESEDYFNYMNEYRSEQRKIKKNYAKLARIQHKLKKQKGK